MSYPNPTAYSEHFSRGELDCHCGCVTPPEVAINLQDLAVHLEELRVLVGGPVHVDDAYRCPSRNLLVGGVKDSQHLQGKAADVAVPLGMTVASLAATAARIPRFNLGGIGMYPSQAFVHMDYRGDGPARWEG